MQAISETNRTFTLIMSLNHLHFSFDFLTGAQLLSEAQILKNYSNGSTFDYLNATAQLEWFTDAFWGSWRFNYLLPFQMILTRWGFCFAFNMVPIENLLHLDRFNSLIDESFHSSFEISQLLEFNQTSVLESSTLQN